MYAEITRYSCIYTIRPQLAKSRSCTNYKCTIADFGIPVNWRQGSCILLAIHPAFS